MSGAGFLFDPFILWFVLVSRIRIFAYLVVIDFHAMSRYRIPIGGFP